MLTHAQEIGRELAAIIHAARKRARGLCVMHLWPIENGACSMCIHARNQARRGRQVRTFADIMNAYSGRSVNQ